MSLLNSTLQLAKRSQYALRSNAGLDNAERQKEFKRFIKQTQKVILAQIDKVLADDKLIEDLLFLLPRVEKAEADQNAFSFVGRTWVSFKEMFSDLFDEDTLFEFYVWSANEGGQNAVDRMGIEVDFVLRNDAVTEFLRNRENLLIQSVDDTTKDQLVRLIQESREKQLTNEELKRMIKSRFDEITEARAEAIARTELAEAFNAVEYETYVRNGVQRMRWVTVMDERVCDICAPLHNEEIAVGANFPGIGQNRPPAHVNCRCFLEEVIEGVSLRGNALVWAGD